MLDNDNIINDSNEPANSKRRRKRIDPTSIFVAVLITTAGAGLYYMHWSTADSLQLVANANANAASVDTFLSGGQAGLATLRKSIRETQGTVAQLTRTPIPASFASDSRDPFSFTTHEAKTRQPLAMESNGSRVQAKARMLEAARKLTVQSIMVGSSRSSCLINGKLYFEGATCGDFVIDSITQDAVYLQGGEFRFELKLRK